MQNGEEEIKLKSNQLPNIYIIKLLNNFFVIWLKITKFKFEIFVNNIKL